MALEIRNLNYIYNKGTNLETYALKDISCMIPDGQFVGIIGKTGSGKSTLIQHMNGLVHATSGEVLWDGKRIYEADYPMRTLRQQVGLVFQYPEHQLFEETVLEDVCFGPKNQGLSAEECEQRAKEALKLTGMGEETYAMSPWELSGGQKRRVAIAGVLAMRPRLMVLDEPTAGLDPAGRKEILNTIREFHEKTGMGVVLVSHSMDDVAEYVERILVIDRGTIRFDGTVREVFAHCRELEEIGLAAPQVTYLMHDLAELGIGADQTITRVDDAVEAIIQCCGISQ